MTRRQILALATRFDRAGGATAAGLRTERRLKARLRRRRARGALYLTRAELMWIGEWKTPRIRPLVARNRAADVRRLTRGAFRLRDDGARLDALRRLSGVGVAVASVVLHFAQPGRYPIYDVRVLAALDRLGVAERFPPGAAGWAAYAERLRALARGWQVSLRTLDKALWLLGGPTVAGFALPRPSGYSPSEMGRSGSGRPRR